MSVIRNGYEDYGIEDVRAAYSRGGWRDWNGLVRWLEESSADDDVLAQAGAYHLAADFRQLANDDIEFTPDADEAFVLARQHCSHIPTIDEGGDTSSGYLGEREHVEP